MQPNTDRDDEDGIDFETFLDQSIHGEYPPSTIIDSIDSLTQSASGLSDYDKGRLAVLRAVAVVKSTEQAQGADLQSMLTRVRSGGGLRSEVIATLNAYGMSAHGGGACGNQLRAFAFSKPPTLAEKQNFNATVQQEADRLVVSGGVCKVRALKTLRSYCTRRTCEHCNVNMECMVAGCTATPIQTGFPGDWQRLTAHSKTFRCVPGLHLCNAHGQILLTKFKPSSPDSKRKRKRHLSLDDGRCVQNIHM